jgi:predicted anti-sigma-YlaC factor YlaD
MRITCDMAMDLAGLYLDHVASRDSVRAVKKHLRGCPACCRYYRDFKKKSEEKRETFPVPTDYMEQYSRLSNRIRKRRTMAVVMMAGVVGLGAGMLLKGISYMKKNRQCIQEGK